MTVRSFACSRCGRDEPADPALRACRTCGAPLDPAFAVLDEARLDGSGLWRYREWLPFALSPVSLGEAATPLVDLRWKDAELVDEPVNDVEERTRSPIPRPSAEPIGSRNSSEYFLGLAIAGASPSPRTEPGVAASNRPRVDQ